MRYAVLCPHATAGVAIHQFANFPPSSLAPSRPMTPGHPPGALRISSRSCRRDVQLSFDANEAISNQEELR